MDRNEKIVVAVAITYLTAYAGYGIHYLNIRRQERAKRAAIKLETEQQIAAMKVAQGRIQERIRSGSKHYRSIADIMNDFEFETIAVREGE